MSDARLFISWSGATSKAVANKIYDFLVDFMPGLDAFISTEDIKSGDRWFDVVSSALDTSEVGIAVLTPENLGRPWIYFEAGAISKRVGQAKLIPVMCGLTPADLRDTPLAGFQAEALTKEGIFSVVTVIRRVLGYPLDETRLPNVFDVWWAQKGADLLKAADAAPTKSVEPRTASLDDISAQLEQLQSSIRRVELALSHEHETARSARGSSTPGIKLTAKELDEMIELFGGESALNAGESLRRSLRRVARLRAEEVEASNPAE